LTEREVAETDRIQGLETRVDGGVIGEEGQGVADRSAEQIGDRTAVPSDGENFRFEAGAVADWTRHEDIREKLHLDAFVAEALAMIAATVAGVEGKAGGGEPGGGRGGFLGVELANTVPRLTIQRRIGAGRARERTLIDEHNLAAGIGAFDGGEGGDVFGLLMTMGEQALVDDVIEQGGFARAGNTAETDETLQGQIDVEVAEIVFGGAAETQLRGGFVDRSTRGGRTQRGTT